MKMICVGQQRMYTFVRYVLQGKMGIIEGYSSLRRPFQERQCPLGRVDDRHDMGFETHSNILLTGYIGERIQGIGRRIEIFIIGTIRVV